jgi:hypothetical protein
MSRSAAETLLAVQLDQAGIPYEREFRFAPPRRWRADFQIRASGLKNGQLVGQRLLVEIDGGSWVAGRHTRGAGFEADLEKHNAAALLGYRVLRFTPAMVDDGRALDVIRQALGLAVAA